MKTVRLTAAQALVRFLAAQHVERDGVEQRFFGGCFGIFGHGNVAGIGEALYESPELLRYVAQARDRGLGVIFITHNPHHAYPVGDRFVILNRGRLMGDWRKSEISRDELVKQMSGGAELDALEHELQRELEAPVASAPGETPAPQREAQ